MSVAVLEAEALNACLEQGEARLATHFFRRAATSIDTPWSTAVGNDLRFPEIAVPRTVMMCFIAWYLGRLHHAAHHDAEVSLAFLRVANLQAPSPSVLRPAIVWWVLRANLWPRRGEQAAITS